MVSGDRKITMAKKKKKGVTRDRAHDTVSENTYTWDARVQRALKESISFNNQLAVILKALADARAAESAESEEAKPEEKTLQAADMAAGMRHGDEVKIVCAEVQETMMPPDEAIFEDMKHMAPASATRISQWDADRFEADELPGRIKTFLRGCQGLTEGDIDSIMFGGGVHTWTHLMSLTKDDVWYLEPIQVRSLMTNIEKEKARD